MLHPKNDLEKANTEFLERLGLDYGYLRPTDNGISHSIMDANKKYRGFLTRNGIHDYESQALGAKNDLLRLPTKIILQDEIYELTEASLYRANKRGDRRIRFPLLKQYFEGGELLVSLWLDGTFWLLNASRLSFEESPALASAVMNKSMEIMRGYLNRNPADSTRSFEVTSTGGIDERMLRAFVPKEFKPKDRHDYLVQIQGRTERRRGDRHELLLAEYADLADSLGHQPSNTRVHPRDLTLQVAGEEWLVEAKVVYDGNASQASRAAIGQLLEYSHFIYAPGFRPRMMALFTEPLGDAFIALLETHGIAAVWKGRRGWDASGLARKAGLI